MITEYEFKDHDEWLAIRGKYIGGSDAGAVVGMNPYKGRYTLWAEKTGKIPAFDGNLTTKVGAYLEDLVAQLFEEETGKKVRKKNRTMVNDLYPFACANIDRAVVGERALLEIKTTNSVPIMKQLRNTDFPEAYYCQVMHYLAVTGLKKAYLAVLVNCRDFRVYELNRDEKEIEALMEAEREFWKLVESDTPPSVDVEESTSNTIEKLYPESSDREIDLWAYEKELRNYMELSEQIKALTKLKDEQANIIKEFMKDAFRGACGNYIVSFKSSERTTFDSKRFMAEHKNINLDDYNKITTVRSFKVSMKGDK